MKNRVARPAGLAFLALLFLAAFRAGAAEPVGRLVSLAPSLTEMVFAIGAGDRLVGVTDHCRYPPEAAAIAKVGGYQTPNFEAILALNPDIVLTLREHSPSHPLLASLGLRYEVFDHRSLAGLLDSFTRLGELCDRAQPAALLRDEVAEALRPPPDYREEEAPSLLFVIGRDYGKGLIANATVVGRDGLYENLITAVGCRNAYRGDAAYPSLSGEGVALLDPDIVVEGVYAEMGTGLDETVLRLDWDILPGVAAVREDRVYYIRSDYVFIPGARLVLLKRDLAAAVAGLPVTGLP